MVHGLVDTAKRFTMADLRRLPSVSRRHFIECSGNTSIGYKGQAAPSVQRSHGLLSTSEWTGVPFAALARAVGLRPDASWMLAANARYAANFGAKLALLLPPARRFVKKWSKPIRRRHQEPSHLA